MKFWYRIDGITCLLWPLSWLFGLIAATRRFAFCQGWLKSVHVGVPTIVVGNISVGGNGKTPVVIGLCEWLTQLGYRPGVISRGYGGNAPHYPLLVDTHTTGAQAGDEPVLIYHRTGCPVVVSPKRIEAAQYLIEHCHVNVIISDDGLQHYALQRDIEIVVVDGERRFGNGLLLPAGPLRESKKRLNSVDFVINNGADPQGNEFAMSLKPSTPKSVVGQVEFDADEVGKKVNACAGIGHPPRFFNTLKGLGFELVQQRAFADHHAFKQEEIQALEQQYPLFMTEKDAVKCRDFELKQAWYLPVSALIAAPFKEHFIMKLKEINQNVRP
ncbi:tetraacyldisaccharide 4'-kinase [Motilimonas sp. 1_MG-2023]|uniref:tetraacyldisaccharide 4'-kinase n=1 Tax=Motilimonas sp. 1_MG-2023 TaxID=3062672 RepID=UPI0026E3F782|nr:tetraacyldisaccharide 4'-kinase [Motilimonas sp. 1_MG-2023]MDO6524713.1 tetraacyldisaccharide 4'-kinase [Motilimonas sp. 1_MG-2023]